VVCVVEWKASKHLENRWKRSMLPKWLLSIKVRTCNQTPLVHQDRQRKQPFYKKLRRVNLSKNAYCL